MPVLLKNKSQAAGALYTAAIALYFVLSLVGGAILSALPQGSFARTAISPLFAAVALLSVSFLSAKAYGAVGGFSEDNASANNFSADNSSAGNYAKSEGKPNYKTVFGYKKFKPAYLLAAVLISAGIFCGLGFINTAFAELLAKIGVNLPNNEIKMNGAGEYIILSFTLAVIPAIAEEMFFRGAVAFGTSGAKLFAGAAFSGLIFALYHCSLSQLLYQFIYGAILYILAKKSGSVFPSAIAHFLNNFAVITLTFFGAEVNLFSPVLIASGIVALMLAAALIFFIDRKTGASKTECETTACETVERGKTAEKATATEAGKTEKSKETKNEEKFSVKDFMLPFGAVGVLACVLMGAASLL